MPPNEPCPPVEARAHFPPLLPLAIREDRAGAVSTFDLYNYVHQVLSAESVQGIAAPPAYEDAPPAFSEEEEGEEEVPVTESLIRNDVALEFALDNDTLNERKIDKVATDRGQCLALAKRHSFKMHPFTFASTSALLTTAASHL